jgi:hypothetical protein
MTLLFVESVHRPKCRPSSTSTGHRNTTSRAFPAPAGKASRQSNRTAASRRRREGPRRLGLLRCTLHIYIAASVPGAARAARPAARPSGWLNELDGCEKVLYTGRPPRGPWVPSPGHPDGACPLPPDRLHFSGRHSRRSRRRGLPAPELGPELGQGQSPASSLHGDRGVG